MEGMSKCRVRAREKAANSQYNCLLSYLKNCNASECLLKNAPIHRGTFAFCRFILYLVDTKLNGLNLYPYDNYVLCWSDPCAFMTVRIRLCVKITRHFLLT